MGHSEGGRGDRVWGAGRHWRIRRHGRSRGVDGEVYISFVTCWSCRRGTSTQSLPRSAGSLLRLKSRHRRLPHDRAVDLDVELTMEAEPKAKLEAALEVEVEAELRVETEIETE